LQQERFNLDKLLDPKKEELVDVDVGKDWYGLRILGLKACKQYNINIDDRIVATSTHVSTI
jgi:hypothetical protein